MTVRGVLTLGETMGMFSATATGSLAQVDGFRLGIGGADSNVAIGLARLGTPVTWIGRIGADEIGARVLRELRAEGVDANAIVDAGAPTGLMIKSRPAAHLVKVTYRRDGSAGSRLSVDDIDPALVRGARLVHVTGITPALSASAAAAIDHVVDIAVEAGVPVSFDVNHRSSLWSSADAALAYRRLASRSSVLFAGESEARLLVGGATPAELAEELAGLGVSQVIVKRGAEGCVAMIDGVAFAVPAIAITAVDTVGAGDAFVAGYLSELLAGSEPNRRLETGVRCGAFACLGPGDWESFPTRSDLSMLESGDPVLR